jgi:hypothetical protein
MLTDGPDIAPLFHLDRRNILSAVPENARHPNQLIQKFIDASDIFFIEQLALFIKKRLHGSEVHVLENDDETKFTHDRRKIFDYPSPAEWSVRNATNSDRLMDVFL